MRTLRKNPGFAAVAVLTLAIGIGANTAIFSFVNGVLLKPPPYGDPDRIVRVLEKPPGGERNGISTLNFLDWQKDNTVFEYMAAQAGGPVTLTGVSEPVLLRGSRVSAHYFDIFGVKAALGRTFVEGEDRLGKDRVAVLSHSLWLSQFGADPGIPGRSIILDGRPHTVIGVLPAGGAFDRAFAQIWRPLAFEPENMTRNFHWFGAFARLKPGVTLKRAVAQMDAIGARIAKDYPDSNKGWGVKIDLFAETLVGEQLRQSLYVLLAAVGMVLLIGCANLANLTLARGIAREREVAIRASIGAGRWRLMRQFLTENVLLSFIGGVLGLGLGLAMKTGLEMAIPPYSLPREADVSLDGRVLLFTLGLAIFTGIIFGLAPALQATRPNLAGCMKEGGRGMSAGGHYRVRSGLVVTEVALAFMLLTGAGLLIRSFFEMQQVDTGFDATNVLTAGLPIPEKRYPDADQLNSYLRQVVANVEALPGVRDVALTSALPMQGWGYGMPFQRADRPMVDRANRRACFFKMVSPSYFRVLGMKVLRGRPLSDTDAKGAPPVTVINETMARLYFKGEDPIGKRILVQEIVPGKTQLGSEVPWEVVGMVADEKVDNLDSKRDNPGMYVSNTQSPVYFQALVVRAAMDPMGLKQALSRAIHDINKDQTLTEVKTLEQVKAESMASNRLRSLLLTVFAMIAVVLAAIGIYGVISYSVEQRTHEIGIRAALGASKSDLMGLIVRGGMLVAGAGLAVGFTGSYGLTRLLAGLLFGVGAHDPMTTGAVAGVLSFVAILACYIPARRAARVDPMVALRYE
ncbi:MAG: ABC transporter permease [Bryobacterales bacterium]|nr:ABC transporter permease [Bryobacterales bacterium]